jgi:hypothetical protein
VALAPDRTDWRWLQAVQATDFTDSQAQYQLRDADDVTRRAYLFKRAADAGLDTSRWPEFEAAHELWANRPTEKLFIEGMLLGKQSVDRIAYDVCCGSQDIQIFHDLFFDVTHRLDRPGWLVARMFQGNLYSPLSSRDRVGIMHRLAWLAGPELFKSYYTGVWDPSIADILKVRIADMTAKQALVSSMCIGGRGDLDIEVLRLFFDDAKQKVKDTVAQSGDKGMSDAVMGFLSDLSVKVANPLDPANLHLPAREPRAHEIIAQSLSKVAP